MTTSTKTAQAGNASVADAWAPYQQYAVGAVVTYDGLTLSGVAVGNLQPRLGPERRGYAVAGGARQESAARAARAGNSSGLECDGDLHSRHGRHGERHRLSGELVDARQQPGRQ
jgi:hypothetical protein